MEAEREALDETIWGILVCAAARVRLISPVEMIIYCEYMGGLKEA